MRFKKHTLRWLFLMLCFVLANAVFAQSNKIKITQRLPLNLQVCGNPDTFSFEVRNITINTISSIEVDLVLPAGIYYVPGSVSGTGVSEKNITNLQKPIFTLPDLAITQAISVTIKLRADCIALGVINSGGSFANKITARYTGGSDGNTGTSYTAKVPSLVINSITNKSFTGIIGEKFVRILEIKNFGNGPLSSLNFNQKNGTGLKVIGVSGGNYTLKADSVLHFFDSTFFKNVGNNDVWLDKDESVFIYDTLEIGACSNLLSDFWVGWGCGGSICQSKTDKANAIIKAISPNLVITPKTIYHNCYGSDSAFQMSLMVINKGTDKARNVLLDITQAVNYTFINYLFSRIDSASIMVRKGANGKDSLLPPLGYIYNRSDGIYSCLGNSPLGGFTWKIGEIDIGDTLILSWKVYTCCVSSCNSTKYMAGWKYTGYYADQCQNVTNIPESIGWGGLSQYFGASSFTPSDIASGEKKTIYYNISSAGFWGLNSRSKFELDLILNKGLTHSLNPDDILFEAANGTLWKPVSVSLKGDTVRALFNYSSISFTQSELRIVVSGDCASLSKSGNVNFALNFYYTPDPSCNQFCKQHIFCTTGTMRVHCPVSCGGGMNFKNFTAERISYGLPDNNDDGIPDTTGVLDKTKIKTYMAMYSDTILTTFSGIVTQSGTTFFWDYGYASSKVLYGKYLSIIDATIEIYRAKTLRFSCDSVKYTSTYTGNNATFNFDFGRTAIASKGCAGASGFRLASGDSVCIKVRYRVDANTGGSMLECRFDNEMYISTVANPTNSQKRQCDTFNGNIVVVGYYFTNYGAGSYTLAGCNDLVINQNYYLSIGPCCGNYAGGNLFRYEYRNWARIAEIKLIPPPGYKFIYAYTYYYRTAGTLGTKYEYTPSITPKNNNADTLSFEMRKFHRDSSGPYWPSDDGFHGYFYAKLKATCQSAYNVSESIKYDMVFDQKGLAFSDPITIPSGGNSDNITFNRPIIKLNAVTNKILASKDTVEWVVRLNNNAPTSDALYTWISFKPSKGITVTGITSLKTGTPLVFKGGLYQSGTVKANSYNDYLIKAVYNSCSYDSLEVQAGWDCSNYPDSITSYDCAKEMAYVYLEPVPTLLQSTISGISGKVDLCDKTEIEVTITNSDEPNAYDLQLLADLPEGVVILDSALRYRIHKDSAFKKLNYPTLSYGNSWIFNLSKDIAELNNGLKGVLDPSRNKITIRMLIETNCNFSSGSFIRVLPKGRIKCGMPVKAGVSISSPLLIKNIIEPYYSDIRLTVDTLKPCSDRTKLNYRVIFLGPKSTDTTDRFRFFVPRGYEIDTNSFVDILKSPKPKPNLVYFNGNTIAEWSFYPGMKAGDSSLFSFYLKPLMPFAECGTIGILSQVAVKQEALCVKDSSICIINVVTGSNYLDLPIRKGNIVVSNIQSVSRVYDALHEEVIFNGKIVNTGAAITDWKSTLYLIADRNNNNAYDFADTIYSLVKFDSLLSNSSLQFTMNSKVLGSDVCNLYLATDTTTCACNLVWYTLYVEQLKNSGIDTSICSGEKITLGATSVSNYQYKWTNSSQLNYDTISNPIFNVFNNSPDTLVANLRLTTNRGSCSSVDTVQIKVFPAIQFVLSDTVFSCEKDTLMIGNTASGGNGSFNYQWSNTSKILNPNSPYPRIFPDSNMLYQIVIKDAAGCTLKDSVLAVVTPKPISDFTIELPCESTVLHFNDLTNFRTAGAGKSEWYLNNNAVNNDEFVIPYPFAYQLKLVSTNSKGCSDSLEKSFNSYPVGLPDFSYNLPCDKSDFLLTNKSVLPAGLYQTINWVIGTDTFAGNNAKITLGNTGYFNVTLITKSDQGCVINKDSLIYVFAKPKAGFNYDKVCYGDSLPIRAYVAAPDDAFRWIIDKSVIFNDSSIVFKGTTVDSFSVWLETTSASNCKDTIQSVIQVHPKPALGFTSDTICLYEQFIPTNNSTISSGIIDQFLWDMNDGITYQTKDISHQFKDSGWYAVKLAAISNFKCTDSIIKFVRVHPDAMTKIGILGHCEQDTYQFSDLSQYKSTASGNATWNLDGNTLIGSIVKDVPAKGFHRMTLNTITPEGCHYNLDTIFYVHPLPVVQFSQKSNCLDNLVTFSNQTFSDSNNTHAYLWQFGDGNVSTLKNPPHTYSNSGNNDVTLSATNAFGCEDSINKKIVVNPAIYSAFTVNEVCEDEEFIPVNESNAGNSVISGYKWDFGDGTTSLQQSPIKSYAKAGTYSIKLEIKNAQNCTFDSIQDILVNPKPIPGFNIYGEPLDIFKSDIQVNNQGTGAVSFLYNISDGNSYTSADFGHTFSDSGKYQINQILTSAKGCKDSLEKEVYVFFKYLPYIPTAFTPNDDGKNDRFGMEGVGILNVELSIYSRWGELIFRSTPDQPKWDGKYKGSLVQPGAYLYSAKVVSYSYGIYFYNGMVQVIY